MNSADSRIGVLLINVGTPDSTDVGDVRRYLREFLSDPRVIDINPVGRWLLLNLIVLPTRPAKSAEAYKQIWTPEGSPLLLNGQALADGLAKALGDRFEVRLGHRYGNPSIVKAMDHYRALGIDRIVLFPLYPQYAASSTGTSLEHVYALSGERWSVPHLSVVQPFYDDPGFVSACAEIGRPILDEMKPDQVLFSYHGLPQRHVSRCDDTGSHCLVASTCCDQIVQANRNCYRAQCFANARLMAAELALPDGQWTVAFQSRLGRTPWIKPYTDEVIPELARKGRKRMAVFVSSFVADCLETLEEIGMRAKADFLAAGG
ncbi:MAG: ferrochelatase, partial [Myxococcota bacterium]